MQENTDDSSNKPPKWTDADRIAMPWSKPLMVCSKALRNLEHMEKFIKLL